MRTNLAYRDERSDKVYTVELRPSGALWEVFAVYGRRGGMMATDAKTKAGPVGLAEAQAIRDRLVREKTAKGYRPAEEGAPEVEPELPPRPTRKAMEPVAMPAPMLLNPITRDEAVWYTENDDWSMESKFDGIRVRLIVRRPFVAGYSRADKTVTIPKNVAAAARELGNDCVLDGELVGCVFIAFDVLRIGELDTWGYPLEDRQKALKELVVTGRAIPGGERDICVSPVANSTSEKRAMLEACHNHGAEGVVFKRKNAPYTPGRPNSGGLALKCKFVNTASVIVRNAVEGSQSMDVMLRDGRYLGSVTMIGHRIPPPGTVVEVRYLYVHDVGGKLIQPAFVGIREDISRDDCTADQLQVKGAKR